MTTSRAEHRSGCSRPGVTLVELLVYMVVGSILLLGAYGMMLSQGQVWAVQRGMMDVQHTLRSGGHLLAWELRQLSADGGDVYRADPTSITIRSYQGSAIICNQAGSGAVFGLYQVEGEAPATGDSVVVFVPGGVGPGDDEWRLFSVVAAGAPGGLGLGSCSYVTGPPPEQGLKLDPASSAGGIVVGSFVRTFQRVEYGAHSARGRWWLGRRVQGGPWESIAGPLADSAGVSFTYRDAAGGITTAPAAIAVIDVVIRGETVGPVAAGDRTTRQDTVSFKVFVRG